LGAVIGFGLTSAFVNQRITFAEDAMKAVGKEKDAALQETRTADRQLAEKAEKLAALQGKYDQDLAALRRVNEDQIALMNGQMSEVQSKNTDLQSRVDRLTKDDDARKKAAELSRTKVPQERFASDRDSLPEAVKHLDQSGVPIGSALSLLGGKYTITASAEDYPAKVCHLMVTDTEAPSDDPTSSVIKHLGLGKSADIAINGRVVNFIYRFRGMNICAFDVKLR
jgi:hypothetical protein